MLVSLLLSTSLCYAQNTYFWNGKDKVDLKVDSTEVLIKVKERDDINKLINKINQSDNRTEVKEISIGGQVFILAKKFDKKSKTSARKKLIIKYRFFTTKIPLTTSMETLFYVQKKA